MTFDDITGDGRLWAVRYENEQDNELYRLFEEWNDVIFLRAFFKTNIKDLSSYFNISDVNEAIRDTIEDSENIETIIMDVSPEANLDDIFRSLSNYYPESYLEKSKARLERRPKHASWLRIYAIKLEPGIYIITGGAIKLTQTMEEREHTKLELVKIERVRTFCIEQGIVDESGFTDYIKEII